MIFGALELQYSVEIIISDILTLTKILLLVKIALFLNLTGTGIEQWLKSC
jgi:hypothetical protein